jgi:hypothetical protein
MAVFECLKIMNKPEDKYTMLSCWKHLHNMLNKGVVDFCGMRKELCVFFSQRHGGTKKKVVAGATTKYE